MSAIYGFNNFLRLSNPSVCPSHSGIVCKTNAYIDKLFSTSDKVFDPSFRGSPPLQNFKGNSLSAELNTQGGKNLRFLTEIAVYLISETVRDSIMVTNR